MGRPMRPVDPAEGPLQQFAAGLRELRVQAGDPPFRQLAKRAHYSATTLSVACSGTQLPSLDVVLAFVRACGGPEELWRQRWADVAGAAEPASARRSEAPGRHVPAGQPGSAWAAARRALPWAAVSAGSAALGLGVAWLAGAYGPGRQQGSAPQSIGISQCDAGSYRVFHVPVALPQPATIGGQAFPAGTVIGTLYLRYSPRCSEAWPHFSPAGAFFGKPGLLVLRSRSIPGTAVNTSTRYRTITFADGEPMLTVPGCVDAEATIAFGPGGPTAKAATNCLQRG